MAAYGEIGLQKWSDIAEPHWLYTWSIKSRPHDLADNRAESQRELLRSQDLDMCLVGAIGTKMCVVGFCSVDLGLGDGRAMDRGIEFGEGTYFERLISGLHDTLGELACRNCLQVHLDARLQALQLLQVMSGRVLGWQPGHTAVTSTRLNPM